MKKMKININNVTKLQTTIKLTSRLTRQVMQKNDLKISPPNLSHSAYFLPDSLPLPTYVLRKFSKKT
jgi:hypothetical protein